MASATTAKHPVPLYWTRARIEQFMSDYNITPETIQQMKDAGELVEIDEQKGEPNDRIKN